MQLNKNIKMPELSIIIPTYNRSGILENTLDYLINIKFEKEFEIIIVNNYHDGITINEKYKGVKIINCTKNGVAASRNSGALLAKGNWLLFLDDDILVDQSTIQKIYELSTKDTKTIYLPNWVYPDSLYKHLNETNFGRFLIKIKYYTLEGWLNKPLENKEFIELNSGASYFLMIRKSDFLQINGYDEKFPHAGAEDYEFCSRLIKHGYQFYLVKEIYVYHNEKDRINIKEWLERQKRNAITKIILNKATNKAQHNYLIGFILTSIFNFYKPFAFLLLSTFKRIVILDKVSFFIIKTLLYIYIKEAYFQFREYQKQ